MYKTEVIINHVSSHVAIIFVLIWVFNLIFWLVLLILFPKSLFVSGVKLILTKYICLSWCYHLCLWVEWGCRLAWPQHISHTAISIKTTVSSILIYTSFHHRNIPYSLLGDKIIMRLSAYVTRNLYNNKYGNTHYKSKQRVRERERNREENRK